MNSAEGTWSAARYRKKHLGLVGFGAQCLGAGGSPPGFKKERTKNYNLYK